MLKRYYFHIECDGNSYRDSYGSLHTCTGEVIAYCHQIVREIREEFSKPISIEIESIDGFEIMFVYGQDNVMRYEAGPSIRLAK